MAAVDPLRNDLLSLLLLWKSVFSELFVIVREDVTLLNAAGWKADTCPIVRSNNDVVDNFMVNSYFSVNELKNEINVSSR